MIKADIKIDDGITQVLKGQKRALQRFPREATAKFRELTPVATGNARNKTRLVGDNIEANYPYAEVLDKGRHMTPKGMRGSKQAPQGMTKPFGEWVRQKVRQIFGR